MKLNCCLNKILLIVTAAMFVSQFTTAQTAVDSLQYTSPILAINQLFANFDKQLNTYNLNSGFVFFGNLSQLEFHVNQNFRSTLVRTGNYSIRDEQYLHIFAKYKINGFLNPGLSAKSNILSDNRQLAINQATINQAVLFNELHLHKEMILIPYGGFSDNKQIGETDRGPIYGMEGTTRDLYFEDLWLTSSLKLENEDVSPRKNTLRFFDFIVNNSFNPDVANFINAKFIQSRKDFYFSADSLISSQFDINNNIESRTETAFLLQDKLSYDKILDNFFLELGGRLNWRTIDRDTRYRSADVQSPAVFDTKIDELGIFVESSLFYKTEDINAGLRINVFERDEKNITKRFEGIDEIFYEQRSENEARKNNNSNRATISLSGNGYVSRYDRISLSAFHSKLKYDTPSTMNDDDRDELLSILRLRYSRYISPFFEAYLNAEGTYSHVVYLFASRSANNNINRVLRLALGGIYKGAKFSSMNNFEVSANYTVYDFEDLASSLRSISFRQFTATDSTHLKITNFLLFLITGYVKLTDQGELDWDDFAERPSRYLEEIYADPKIGLVYDNTFIALGLRYFSLRTFDYEEKTRIPDTKYLSLGPLFELVISSNRLYLKFNSWYEFISVNKQPSDERVNIILAMNWKF